MKTTKLFKLLAIIAMAVLTTKNVCAQQTTFNFCKECSPNSLYKVMEKNANALFAEIQRAYDKNDSKLNLSDKNLSADAKKRIRELWAVSHFCCNEMGTVYLTVYPMKSSNDYQVRDIPILVSAGDDDYAFQSYIMEFDSSGTICDLTPMIPMHDYMKIMNGGQDVTETRHREKILGFVNDFRAAYNTKDSLTIERMFSEDALIITGKVVNYAPNKESGSLINTQKIEYDVKDKKTYMTRLKSAFKANEYINIDFKNIDVIKSEAIPNVYGVRLDQYWHSTNYSDEGELFLIIDYRNENQPLIWVRAWQPFKNEKGEVIPYTEDQHFSLGRFIK